MTQEERLNELLRYLLREQIRYQNAEIPKDLQGKRDLLQSLMNVREAKEISEEFLAIQDAYLQARAEEKGITDALSLPPSECDARLVLWQGDISTLKIGAIVNAANNQMLGCFQPLHKCIDNIIHTYAGVQLRYACFQQMERIRERLGASYVQPTGIPLMTDAYNLPAGKVVHVVGPIVSGEVTDKQKEQLAACYRNTLMLCERNGVDSVAFCCISTGVFMFPKAKAAEIAVSTVRDCLSKESKVQRVVFNVFGDEDFEIYKRLL